MAAFRFSDLVYMKIGLNGSMTRSRGVDALNASVGFSRFDV